MKAGAGRRIRYCGHNAVITADVLEIEGAVVVRLSGPLDLGRVERFTLAEIEGQYDLHLVDFPTLGFWRPDLGVFVVPTNQLKPAKRTRSKGAA